MSSKSRANGRTPKGKKNAAVKNGKVADQASTDDAKDTATSSSNKSKLFDMHSLSMQTRLQFLRTVQELSNDNRAARTRVARSCEALLQADRRCMVQHLHVKTPLTDKHHAQLLGEFSNLRTLYIDHANRLPSNFIARHLLKLDDDQKAGREQCVKWLADNAELAKNEGLLNPIQHLKVANSMTLSSTDMNSIKHLICLRSLVLNNLPRLSNFSFLYFYPFPEQLIALNFDHCTNLSCNVAQLKPAVLERLEKLRDDTYREAVDTRARIIKSDKQSTVLAVLPHKQQEIVSAVQQQEQELPDEEDDAEPSSSSSSSLRPFDYTYSLSACIALAELSLVQCEKLNSVVLELLFNHAPELRSLNLHTCTWLRDEDVLYLRNMISLRQLNVAKCKRLSNDALVVLCYATTQSVQKCKENQNLLRRCISAAKRDHGTLDKKRADQDGVGDEKELGELIASNQTLQFFRYFGHLVRTDIYHMVQNYALYTDPSLDQFVAEGFPALVHLDVSYNSFEGVDLRIFSTLLTLDTLILDGCSIFQDHANIDQVFARSILAIEERAAQRQQELVKEFREVSKQQKLRGAKLHDAQREYVERTVRDFYAGQLAAMRTEFEETNYYNTQFYGDWRVHQLGVTNLSMELCRTMAKRAWCDGNERSVCKLGEQTSAVAATEEERIEVIQRFKLLCLKHAPHVRTLKLSKIALVDQYVLLYALFWQRHVEHLDVRHCGSIKDVAHKPFVSLAPLAYLLDADRRVIKRTPLRTILFDRCTELGQDSLQTLMQSCASTLETLSVHKCTELYDEAFRNLNQCRRLTNLDVSSCENLGRSFFRRLQNCEELKKTLQRLNIGECDAKPQAIVEALRHFTSLQFVTFDKCKFVTDELLAALHGVLPQLRGFSVRETPKVSKAMLMFLSAHQQRPIVIVE